MEVMMANPDSVALPATQAGNLVTLDGQLNAPPNFHTTMVSSSIRRKPKFTYQSPSSHHSSGLRIEASVTRPLTMRFSTTPNSSSLSSLYIPSCTKSQLSSAATSPDDVTSKINREAQPALKRKKYPMGPPLPLYHPLGRLALSLPELDPRMFGLHVPPRMITDDSSRRTRRPTAKLREADNEDYVNSSLATTPTPATTTIPKEKPSPRKRRPAPGAAKRKRREVDDGDATYPAKRSRNPRGAAATAASQGSAANGNPSEEDGSTIDGPPDGVDGSDAGTVEAAEEKRNGRRTTRSRGGVNSRRESSESETAATNSSVIAGATSAKADDAMQTDKAGSPSGELSNRQ